MLLHSPFSSLLGPNTRLRILFSNTLNLDFSLNVRDHVSQPFSTTGNHQTTFPLFYFKWTLGYLLIGRSWPLIAVALRNYYFPPYYLLCTMISSSGCSYLSLAPPSVYISFTFQICFSLLFLIQQIQMAYVPFLEFS